jgi:hypothetical protein
MSEHKLELDHDVIEYGVAICYGNIVVATITKADTAFDLASDFVDKANLHDELVEMLGKAHNAIAELSYAQGGPGIDEPIARKIMTLLDKARQ